VIVGCTKSNSTATACSSTAGKTSFNWFTRRGYDWGRKMPAVRAAAVEWNARYFIIDGEVVVLAPDGATDFNELERELGKESTESIVFFA
jgi:ATP-dependent DNA ligase